MATYNLCKVIRSTANRSAGVILECNTVGRVKFDMSGLRGFNS